MPKASCHDILVKIVIPRVARVNELCLFADSRKPTIEHKYLNQVSTRPLDFLQWIDLERCYTVIHFYSRIPSHNHLFNHNKAVCLKKIAPRGGSNRVAHTHLYQTIQTTGQAVCTSQLVQTLLNTKSRTWHLLLNYSEARIEQAWRMQRRCTSTALATHTAMAAERAK